MVLYNRHRKVSHTKIPAIILHKRKRNEDREKQQNPASRPDYNHCSRYRIVWHSHKTHKILWHNAEIFGQPPLRGLGNKNLKNDNLFPRKTRAACFETNWRCFEACGFYFGQFRQRLCLYPLSVSKHARYFHIYKLCVYVKVEASSQNVILSARQSTKKATARVCWLLAATLAERGGFEPPKPFRGLHAFQACQFSHSCIFPNAGQR